jgi:hypothetical protein
LGGGVGWCWVVLAGCCWLAVVGCCWLLLVILLV